MSMVGVVGLEPTTSAFRTPRASQLRYTPILCEGADIMPKSYLLNKQTG